MLAKARKLISYDKLDLSLRRQLLRDYPDGFEEAVMRIDAPNPFFAVLLELEEITYLVKLNKHLIHSSVEDLEDVFEESSEMEGLDEDE